MFNRRKQSLRELATDLAEGLTASLGDKLLSLSQFFPFETSGHAQASKRLYLLILLDQVDTATLARCGEVLGQNSLRDRVAPRILSQDEILASTDVFPITFLEMKHNYELLAGKDLLKELHISDVHLRLRCEQEFRNLLMRMQSSFVLRQHSASDLLESLRVSLSSFQRCAYAAEFLEPIKNVEPSNRVEQEAETEARKLQPNSLIIKRTAEVCESATSPGLEVIIEIYGLMLDEVRRLCELVDNLAVA